MVGWHHQLNGHEFEQAPGVGDRQGSLACCSPWGRKEPNVTEQLNNKVIKGSIKGPESESVSPSVVSDSLRTQGLYLARLLCPLLCLRVCSNLCPLSQWCYLTISSSATPFSFCLQSFPASGSFLMSRLFTSGGQSIGASAAASVLPMNIQGSFPLGVTGLIYFLSKGLSGVFSSTTVQKCQFFSARTSLWSNSHIHT